MAAFALGLLILSTQLRSPLLLKVRLSGSGAALVFAAALLRWAAHGKRSSGSRLPLAVRLVTGAAAIGTLIAVPAVHVRHLLLLRGLRAVPDAERARLARHIIAGFRSWDEARYLVRSVKVGGLYVGLHNAAGLTADALRGRLAELIALRAEHGGPRLLLSADQEGGPVSRLSPPLPKPPALASVLGEAAALPEQLALARSLGAGQGALLRGLGVTVNFAPVVDLRLHTERGLLDRYSFIGSRAISADPGLTSQIALAYAQGLLEGGVVPTLKHFPGLGRVGTDTHFFPAHLKTPAAELTATDWRPFRELLMKTPSLLMIGHVYATAVDPSELASSSARLIGGVLRGEWRHDGVIVTDDLCMAPPYYARGGIGGSAVRALAAGLDLVLVTYDGSQVPAVLAALIEAHRGGVLTDATLAASDARLDRLAALLAAAPEHQGVVE